MHIDNELDKKTEYLFGRDFIGELNGDVEITEEEEQKYSDCVNELYKKYNWNDIFNCWESYLHNKCETPIKLFNFANLFWEYEGYKESIPEPYKFLAYFYYRANPNEYEDTANAATIMDSLAIQILHRAGMAGVVNSENPYYNPQDDPKMVEEIKNWELRSKV